MTEGIITKHLYYYLLWKKGQKIVTHQFTTKFGIADVWAINDKMISSEFEIKTSKADLLSELVPIRDIIAGKTHGEGDKFHKHFKYLTGIFHESIPNPNIEYPSRWMFPSADIGDKSVPNNFYYVVPKELVPIAQEYLKGTPYGIISVHKHGVNRDSYSFISEKKVSAIHKNKVGDWMIFALAHRMSWICQKLVHGEQ